MSDYTFQTLLEEVKSLYNNQVEDIKRRVDNINENVSTLTSNINNLLIEYSKFKIHIEAKNGNQLHHLPPCTSLDRLIKDFNQFCLQQSKTSTELKDKIEGLEKEITKIENELKLLENEDKRIVDNWDREKLSLFKKRTTIITLVLIGIGTIIALLTLIFTGV